MSKRILFLLMLAFTCAFMLVGCGGSDGSDGAAGAPGADADTAAIIAELKAQLETGGITIAQYEEAIAALQAQLAAGPKISSVESCATCHDSGKQNDPAHGGDYLTSAREIVAFSNPWKTANVTGVTIAAGVPTVTFTVKSSNSSVVFDALDTATLLVRRYNATTGRWNALGFASGTTYAVAVTTAAASNNQWTTTATVTPSNPIGANFTAGDTILVAVYGNKTGTTGVTSPLGATLNNLRPGFRAVAVYNSTGAGTIGTLDSTVNPRNFISDAPATAVDPSCMKCHGDGEFNYHHNNVQRADGDDCVSCHIGRADDGDELTPAFQITNPASPAPSITGNSALVNRVHGVHSSHIWTYEFGGETKTGYSPELTEEAVYNIGFPSNASECSVCHTTAAQLANATNNSRFTASLCVTCHGPKFWDSEPVKAAMTAGSIPSFHSSYTAATNCQTACHTTGGSAASATLASIHGNNLHNKEVAMGADIAYEIDSVTVTGNSGKVKWRATKAGVAQNVLSTATTAPVFNNIVAASRGSQSYATSILVGWYTGDDLTNQGNTSQGGQPGTTVNITTSNTAASTTAGYYETTFTIPTTVTATKGIVAIQGVPVVWSGGTAYLAIVDSVTKNFNRDNTAATARRQVVDINLCLDCHTDFLGHGHNRINNIELCVTCHNANATDKDPRVKLAAGTAGSSAGTAPYNTTVDGKTEESYDLKVMLHSIHSSTDAKEPYMVYRTRGIFTFYSGDDAELSADNGATGNASFWSNIAVHYPRPLTSCTACHVAGTFQIADQTKAVAVTVGAGSNLASHADDTVIGPNAAACASCHRGAISDSAAIRSHAVINGYKTSGSTKEEILDLAK